eukprot:9034640-Pyramimonas_sp.AAC.1
MQDCRSRARAKSMLSETAFILGHLRSAPPRRSPIANFCWNAAAATTWRSRAHSSMRRKTSASRAGIWELLRWALSVLSGFTHRPYLMKFLSLAMGIGLQIPSKSGPK